MASVSIVTEELIEDLEVQIRTGLPLEPACNAICVSYQVIWQALQRGEAKWKEKSSGFDISARDNKFIKLFQVVRRAEAEAQQHYIHILDSAALGAKNLRWVPAAWMLERRWPHLYGQRTVVELPKGDDNLENFVIALAKGRNNFKKKKEKAAECNPVSREEMEVFPEMASVSVKTRNARLINKDRAIVQGELPDEDASMETVMESDSKCLILDGEDKPKSKRNKPKFQRMS